MLTVALSVLLGMTAWPGGELSCTEMVGVEGYDDQHTAQDKRHVPNEFQPASRPASAACNRRPTPT